MLIFLFIKCVFFERHPPFAPGGEGVPHTGGPGGLWKRFILRWHSNSAGRWKCVQGGSRYWFTLPAGVGVRPCAAWRTSRYADNKMPVGKRRSAKLPEESRLRGYRAHPSRPTFTISPKATQALQTFDLSWKCRKNRRLPAITGRPDFSPGTCLSGGPSSPITYIVFSSPPSGH